MPGFFDILKQPPVKFPIQNEEQYPLFNRISIETISFCNRDCVFCPVHWNDRGHKSMDDGLYSKIVNELGAVKFDGVAQLFLLSEPMIDVKLPARARELRLACPDVSMYISTNGDVLDKIAQTKGMDAAMERLLSYYEAGINVVNVNIYDAGTAQMDRYKRIEAAAIRQLGCRGTEHKYRHHRVNGRFLCVTDMRFYEREDIKGTDVFYIRNKEERAKLAEQAVKVPQQHCMRTQRHIVVLFDGRVPICCAIDPTSTELLVGNINEQSLLEVWNSEVFYKYRAFTQSARRVLPGCDTCTHKMAFPHVVRKVAIEPSLMAEWEKEVTGAVQDDAVGGEVT